eukprot:TRINITY_DN59602_c0_g1_i1.p1 TRINITY_DN59602_c0_g1~~TRINITY_DN59602_c0_g1_i1.p1  ORF type:complete len:460 (-),score=69.31 TRINITY_DN59602_c0_g1_i1:117-1496(-)
MRVILALGFLAAHAADIAGSIDAQSGQLKANDGETQSHIPPLPGDLGLLEHAAAPLVAKWIAPRMLSMLADTDVPCEQVLTAVDWTVQRLMIELEMVRQSAHAWQDILMVDAYAGQQASDFFSSPKFRSLIHAAQSVHRLTLNVAEFFGSLALLHGARCFWPAMRDAFGHAVAELSDLSASMHRVQFSMAYKGLYAFWDETTDVLKHVEPIWDVLFKASQFAAALSAATTELHSLRHHASTLEGEGGNEMVVPVPGVPTWQDEGGAFSKMNLLYRRMFGGWHLDHGLVASLLRIWSPPSQEALEDLDSCHTTVADFGAGSGHYCKFFNKTGDVCCMAFDGSPNAAENFGGLVQTLRLDQHFDLGRTFDWVMCLEVAEHLPPEATKLFLAGLRRHAAKGLVLSWSDQSEEAHPNALPWGQARLQVEAAGFRFDDAATSLLRPQVSWLRGAVRVFRVAGSG